MSDAALVGVPVEGTRWAWLEFLERYDRRGNVLLTLPFYCFFLASLVHHAVWRDEINAWAISYISPNLGELLHRVHYEAHPALWYVILFAASRFSHGIWMLKLVQGLIGTGIYAALAWWSPFRRLELVLILMSSYLTFQYTVMSRMYGLEVLFALVYCWQRTRHPDRVLRNMVWLALIANVDTTASILAGGLLLEYGLARVCEPGTSGRQKTRELATMAGVFVAAVGIAVASLWPAHDLGWRTTGRLFSNFRDSGQLIQGVMKWVPRAFLPQSINIVDEFDFTPAAPYLYLLPLVLLLLYVVFRKQWRLGVMVGSIIVAGVLFTQITNVAAIRHTGIVYVGFVAALWMMRYAGKPVAWAAYVLLLMCAIAGVIGAIDEWSWPFVDDGAAVQWMRQQHLENEPLFGTPGTNVIGVAEQLDRPMYQLECACVDRVLTFSKSQDHFRLDLDEAAALAKGMDDQKVSNGILLMNRKLSRVQTQQLKDLGVSEQLIGEFDQGFVGDEFVMVYRVKKVER